LATRAYIGALALALALTAGFAACDTGTGTSGDDDGGDNPNSITGNAESDTFTSIVGDNRLIITLYNGIFADSPALGDFTITTRAQAALLTLMAGRWIKSATLW